MDIRIASWTGREAWCLQQTLRMTDRDLADHLGVSRNSAGNWRKGGEDWVCSSGTAQVLDRAVEMLSPADRVVFVDLLRKAGAADMPSAAAGLVGPLSLTSHQFIPLQLGPSAGALFDRGSSSSAGPANLDRRSLGVSTDAGRDGILHVYGFGIGVLHVRQQLRLDSLTDLALWRYPAYQENRVWAQREVTGLASATESAPVIPLPDYVLSLYELRQHQWEGGALDPALQLLASPGGLVDRTDESRIVPLGIEGQRLADGWRHPDAICFTGGVSRGVASWSGVAYHPEPGERSLLVDDIVAMELDTQALWALSAYVLNLVEDGLDPELPEPFGWRWLRGVHTRLTSARPTETAEHRAMRAAVIGTSDLPQRLQAAWAALKEAS
ncbi:XRE family transcriptional regulator [Kitasatospora sp. NPDC002965]|uniref:XRE family transcriptional regulator n=1 Tax=Kitasatospora sp. NPDC002965 TaxID=3154775 RepID=UPI0033B7D7D7